MNALETKRRSFLLGLGGLGVSRSFLAKSTRFSPAATGAAEHEASVLAPGEGEHLIHFRDHGNIFIKASSATGSSKFAFGTQQVTKGAGIPVHRHLEMDEAFYILEGSGTVMLNDVAHAFEKGATVFIPTRCWHGFSNPDSELLLLWIVAPAGLDGFFRETCSAPGAPPKQLSRDEIRAIALKYGTEFR